MTKVTFGPVGLEDIPGFRYQTIDRGSTETSVVTVSMILPLPPLKCPTEGGGEVGGPEHLRSRTGKLGVSKGRVSVRLRLGTL